MTPPTRDRRQQPNGTVAVDPFDAPTNRRKMGQLTTRENLLREIEMAEAIDDWPLVERLRGDLARLEDRGEALEEDAWDEKRDQRRLEKQR